MEERQQTCRCETWSLGKAFLSPGRGDDGGVEVLTNAKGGGWMAAPSESWGDRGSNPDRVDEEMVKKKEHGSLMDVEAGTRIYQGTWKNLRRVSASHADDNRTQKAQKALRLVLLTAPARHERDGISAWYIYNV